MNWDEFFKSDEFRAYRKRQIEQLGIYIEYHLKAMVNGSDPTETTAKLAGAMETAKRFINLPEILTDSNELKDLLEVQKKEDYAALSKFLVMRQMQ